MASSSIKSMLQSQVQGVLATVTACHRPATALMAFAVSPDLGTVFLASSVSARKAVSMIERPHVSMLWDNRTGNVSDHSGGLLVTARGMSILLEGERADEGRDLFREKNPNMSQFLDSESVGIFGVSVEAYEVVLGYERPETWVPPQ